MNSQIYDYRNGKYQGIVNRLKQRNGLGVFVDDDLTFYVSHWNCNKLDGATLVYLTHGKYIYGDWKGNQPNGLNVFRSGDTVLVGKFVGGSPAGRCLLIFQKYNFACILEEGHQEWNIVDSGQLVNHKTLLKYIEMIGIPVPDSYFSLTKFACSFSNNNSTAIKTFPCQNNHCYFGFINGLALIFNANNGVVSVGHHYNEQLCEFGGRFEGMRSAQEGNFELGGDKINYCGNRPSAKIYSIFQKLHKCSLNFHNQYFDSKIKIFNDVDYLLRGKLKEIADQCRKNYQQYRNIDLNDSLDYQEYNEQESAKINSIRDQMYSQQQVTSTPKKTQDQQGQAQTHNYFRKNNEKKQNQIAQSTVSNKKIKGEGNGQTKSPINGKTNQQEDNVYLAKRSPFKMQKKQNQNVTETLKRAGTPKAHRKQQNNHQHLKQYTDMEANDLKESKESKSPTRMKQKMKSNNLRYINEYKDTLIKDYKERTSSVLKSNNIYKESRQSNNEEQINTKEYPIPTFKGLSQDHQQPITLHDMEVEHTIYQRKTKQKTNILNKNIEDNFKQLQITNQSKRQTQSKLSMPIYEDISERRNRILKEYKDINTKQMTHTKQQNNYIQSPCHGFAFSVPKDQPGSFGYIPLTIANNANQVEQQYQNYTNQSKPWTKHSYKQQKINNYQQSEGQIQGPNCIANKRKVYENRQFDIINSQFKQQETYLRKNLITNTKTYPANKPPKQQQQNTVPSWPQQSSQTKQPPLPTTPQRQKRNYQYIYQ